MRKLIMCGFALSFMLIGMLSFEAFSSTGWREVNWRYQYLYPNGANDTNTYLKYYFTDEGSYDAINAYYASGGDKTISRAETKDGGNQLVYGKWASDSSGYPKTSTAKQGAKR